MSERTSVGLAILTAGVVVGLAGDILLRVVPWGVNWPLWVFLLAAASLALARRRGVALLPAGRFLLLVAVTMAVPLAWRDSLTLNTLNVLLGLSALALAPRYARFDSPAVAGWLDYLATATASAYSACVGLPLLLASDVQWRELPRRAWLPLALATVRGVALAVPLLLVFGALLAAADAAFSSLVARLIDFQWREIFGHLLLISLWTWLVTGFLRQLLVSGSLPAVRLQPGGLRIGSLELWIVLGSLGLLFLGFVLVQLRYLFGGMSLIEASVSLSYSEYARRGFFELVTVASLVLPTLLLLDWLRAPLSPRQEAGYRLLLGLLIGLLFVILVSAAQRMRLYVEEFGLSELRLYASAFMGWLAVVFLWFAATVLRARRERFAYGALLSAYLVAIVLTVANPDDLIVRVNGVRDNPRHAFDGAYAASLSADAVPALLAALPQVPERERTLVARRLLQAWVPPASVDWRGLSRSREEARRLVGEREAELRALAGQNASR
ncbi:MAG: DUF4153 domain-containing protein [Chloroflexota bacterium]